MNYPQPPVPQAMPTLSPALAQPAPAAAAPRSLLDLMSDGFYLLMLLKRGQLPASESSFVEAIQRFLEGVERGAVKLGIAAEDIYAAKYAFCAAVDEAILSQPSPMREDWERNPLQLRLFGEHLAGEHFFDRLEQLRGQGAARLPSLEVYHYCLLLGFEGKYRLEGPEKLGYLTARLGDEIAYLKGKRAPFAPHWAPPDKVAHTLRRIVPVWAPAVAMAAVGALAFLGLHALLGRQTDRQLAHYQDVVQMPARTAHLTITLP
ncbi:type IVB secretion system protein IcmH/DotU [Vulcaniibacterium tengchongense]|uniref:Type VI secretion system protein ImpK n=1 Tax=Vulcaniibacterium tengchongense TaxID=1273429 RepID=A0A3N4V856_9GAMM|nr:type IVB secretion system protein IcmH/DotU [Vulcaniibacterium tengchongense]RPE75879.1 type VI secretion system protein ImpK [Vulcaniibacterium tengchongense]